MKKKVLIIDDSPIIHKLLNKAMESSDDFEINGEAYNGREGVELFRKLQPDVILLDITMPVMNGIDTAIEIKKINPMTPIIMLSAMGDEEIIGQAQQAGIDLFLKKPFTDYMIVSALSKIV